MKSRLSTVIAVLLMAWAARGLSQSPQSVAIKIEQAVEASRPGDLWPGFDPKAVPLAVFDGQQTYLFRHPTPPAEYRPLAGMANATVRDGRDPAITANTNGELGGVATATLLLNPAKPLGSAEQTAAVAMHEAFHVYQRQHHPKWSGNEADLFTYPVEDAKLLSLRRQETQALAKALSASSEQDRGCWARSALSARKARFAGMPENFAAYERGTELNEGLATYVQRRAERSVDAHLDKDDFPATAVRQRAYATGTAMALLLDRQLPSWRQSLETNDQQTLDGMLGTALGSERVCSLDAAVQAAIGKQAKKDVDALAQDRRSKLKAFEDASGWHLRVQAANGMPLWPKGFDPLNVERLDESRILHSRFVKLGNDAGEIEVLGKPSLTMAAGKHPLFEGIHQLDISGLAQPSIKVEGTTVSLASDGITMKFANASLRHDGQTEIIVLGH